MRPLCFAFRGCGFSCRSAQRGADYDWRTPGLQPVYLDEVENEPNDDHNDEDREQYANNVVRHNNLLCSLSITLDGVAENPLMPDGPIVAPIPPNPADQYSIFTKLWLTWVAAFVVVESVAVWQDKVHDDRVKRTLSSNARTWFATDSITGIPLDAPYGKLRRLALLFLLAWLAEHLKQQGRV